MGDPLLLLRVTASFGGGSVHDPVSPIFVRAYVADIRCFDRLTILLRGHWWLHYLRRRIIYGWQWRRQRSSKHDYPRKECREQHKPHRIS
jgi:hypothetical protein